MSIVAALKRKGNLWVVADKQITWGASNARDDHSFNKITVFKNAVIGQTGICLFGTALSYLAERDYKMYNRPFNNKWDVLEFFFDYYDFIKAKFSLGNPANNEVSALKNSSYLVVSRDKIYMVSSNRDVTEFDNFSAIGSGSELALGAIDALYDIVDDTQEILKRAWRSATRYNTGCGGEIQIVNVTQTLESPPPGPPEDASVLPPKKEEAAKKADASKTSAPKKTDDKEKPSALIF